MDAEISYKHVRGMYKRVRGMYKRVRGMYKCVRGTYKYIRDHCYFHFLFLKLFFFDKIINKS
jgi:hypothetical protein